MKKRQRSRAASPSGGTQSIQRIVLSRQDWAAIADASGRRCAPTELRVGRQPIGFLAGRVHDDVLFVQEWSATRPKGRTAISLVRCADGGAATGFDQKAIPAVVAVWDGDVKSLPRVFCVGGAGSDGCVEIPRVVYDPRTDPFTRVEGIFETRRVSGRRVTVVGLGSFGACIAGLLARCAVDSFCLMDFDRLEPANISRHICDLGDLGRHKTRAVAERLLAINPTCNVETHEVDVTAEPHVLEAAVRTSALVVVCSDTSASRHLANELCLRHNVPAVFGGAYDRAYSGMVLRVPSRDAPCYECITRGALRAFRKRLGKSDERRRSYRSRARGPERPEPGLCLDAQMIAMIQARMALETLLQKTPRRLRGFPSDLVLWGNRQSRFYPQAFYGLFVIARRRSDCWTHAAVERGLGKKAAEGAEGLARLGSVRSTANAA